MRIVTCRSFVGALVLMGVGLAGCTSTNTRNVSYNHITNNLTPEMKGLSERPSDDRTAFRSTSNQNLRMFWDDLGRAFYLDSPSRLHPFPVVTTSGQYR